MYSKNGANFFDLFSTNFFHPSKHVISLFIVILLISLNILARLLSSVDFSRNRAFTNMQILIMCLIKTPLLYDSFYCANLIMTEYFS